MVRVVLVGYLHDLWILEARCLDCPPHAGSVDRLVEGDLDLGAPLEVRAVVGPRIENEDDGGNDEKKTQRDPEPPLAHEIENASRLEELHRSYLFIRLLELCA